jgi:hypothetical protein
MPKLSIKKKEDLTPAKAQEEEPVLLSQDGGIDRRSLKRRRMKIDDKVIRFRDNLLLGQTATDAYLNAGYGVKGADRSSARAAASELKRSTRVKALLAKPLNGREVTAEKIVDELHAAAFAMPSDELTWNQKIKALELLGKAKGLFQDQREKEQGLSTVQILNIMNAPAPLQIPSEAKEQEHAKSDNKKEQPPTQEEESLANPLSSIEPTMSAEGVRDEHDEESNQGEET